MREGDCTRVAFYACGFVFELMLIPLITSLYPPLSLTHTVTVPTVVQSILGTVVGQVACGEHHSAILTSAPWNKLSADVSEWQAFSKKVNLK